MRTRLVGLVLLLGYYRDNETPLGDVYELSIIVSGTDHVSISLILLRELYFADLPYSVSTIDHLPMGVGIIIEDVCKHRVWLLVRNWSEDMLEIQPSR